MPKLSYALPVELTGWTFDGTSEVAFSWDYDRGRDKLEGLYRRGKERQWDAATRIDWSIPVDHENPTGAEDASSVTLFGSPVWNRMTPRERAELRLHLDAWRNSQFLHGEQGALVCASRIVETVPDLDAKFYAATQVMDEARHVEVYARYLREKVGFAYPIIGSLKTLLAQILSDRRWDFVYLGMQVLVEGLALAAFGLNRDHAKNKLVQAINAYVMQDEARHVAFGRLALRDLYPQLTQAERDEREEFVVEASYLMRDRFDARDVFERLGLPVEECLAYGAASARTGAYQKRLFSRIVPIVKDIGLWGERVRRAYTDMGIIELGELDACELGERDEAFARALDER